MSTHVTPIYSSRFSLAILAVLCLTLSACSSLPDTAPTPYKPATASNEYGFSSVELSEGQYRVMFKATEATNAASVQEYTLYRAAEIAKANGYSWLNIHKTDVERKATLGKDPVKAESNKQVVSPVLADRQCTMSGCGQVGQPFPTSGSGMTLETKVMKDVYYSIVVQMSQAQQASSFSVTDILQNSPSDPR